MNWNTKKARAPYPYVPKAGEIATGGTNITGGTGLKNAGKVSEYLNSGNVNAENLIEGPVRSGHFYGIPEIVQSVESVIGE